MMATHLRFLCDGQDDGLGRTMQAFQAAHARAQNASEDGAVAISFFDISGKTDRPDTPDVYLNTILRGALRMVAALLDGDVDGEAYNAATDELAKGIAMYSRDVELRTAVEKSEYGDRLGTDAEVRAGATMMWGAVQLARKELKLLLDGWRKGTAPTKRDLTGLKNVLDTAHRAQTKMLEGPPSDGGALDDLIRTLEVALD